MQVSLCFGSEQYKPVNCRVHRSPSFCRQGAGGGALQLMGNRSRDSMAVTLGWEITQVAPLAYVIKKLKKTSSLLSLFLVLYSTCPRFKFAVKKHELKMSSWTETCECATSAAEVCFCRWGPTTQICARLRLCMFASVCQANGFTGDGVRYLLPCVIECNDYRCCVMWF